MSDVLQDFLAEYGRDSVRFVTDVLGIEPQPWQREVLQEYDRGNRRISVRSGHGVGKSWLLSWLMIHHQLCRFPQKTVVTAPTADQLWDALWVDYKAWLKRLPIALQDLFEIKSERVELKAAPNESFVTARTSRVEQPDALQGIHSGDDHGPGFVLLLVDEAAGVPDSVYEAAGGSMSGHHVITVLAGNPTRLSGYFYDTHTKLADLWWTRRVSCLESPYASPEYERDIRLRYGENSNVYRVRILGEFPSTESDAVIPRDLVLDALARDVTTAKSAAVVWGLDCARYGDDRSALCKRQQNKLLGRIQLWTKKDTMTLAGIVAQEYRSTPDFLRPTEINVDVIGIGAGVYDRLRQLGLPARAINVAESPALLGADRYTNLRAELWFKAREWFERRDVTLPESYRHPVESEDLVGELTTAKYRFSPSGKIQVESKDELRRRGRASPDLADALILTLASDAATLTHGAYGSTTWQTKLSRPLSTV